MSPRPGLRSVVINSAYLIGTQAGSSVVRGLYTIALARSLGPEAFGQFAYGVTWYGAFLSLTMLGMMAILPREIGRDRDRAQALVAETLFVRLAAVVVAAALCWSAGLFLETDAQMRILLGLFSFALIGRSVALWSQTVFAALETTRTTAVQEAFFRPLEVTLGAIALFSGAGVLTIAGVHAACWLAQAAYGWRAVGLLVGGASPHWNPVTARMLLSHGLILGMSGVLVGLMGQGVLILYRQLDGGSTALGLLAVSMQAFTLMSAVPGAIAIAAMPVLSRAVDREDGQDLLFSEFMLSAATLLGLQAGLILIVIGQPLVTVVLGPDYAEAGPLMGPAACLVAPMAWGLNMHQILVSRGSAVVPAMCAGIGVLALAASFTPLLMNFGLLGGVMTTALGLLAWCTALLVATAKHGGGRRASLLLRSLLLGTGVLLTAYFTMDFGLMIRFTLCQAVLIVVALLVGITDRGMIRTVVGGLNSMRKGPRQNS